MKFETKHKLKFREDGTFRVVMMSDIQESAQYDPRSLRSVEVILDEADPDLVILGGDNCFGPEIHNKEDLKAFIEIFTAPMEKRGIPWAHVFGNHDHDVKLDLDEHQALYEAHPMCVSMHTGLDVHGKTNFVLPIYNKEDKIALAVWGLDTNCQLEQSSEWVEQCKRDGHLLPIEINSTPDEYAYWGMVCVDQLLWYYNTSIELEKTVGKKVPGLLCMHVPPNEYQITRDNPEKYGRGGNYDEGFCGMGQDPGVVKLVRHRGDIFAISCGHTHMNDYESEYEGIRLFWDACTGYRCYGVNERRGGRLFIFNEANPTQFESQMIRTLGK